MSQNRHLTLVAAGSALLAALPVVTVFDHITWAVRALLVVAAMCGAALLVRSLRAPTLGAERRDGARRAAGLTWLFPSGARIRRRHPLAGHVRALRCPAAHRRRRDARVRGARSATGTSFLFVAALGVAAVAWLVDLFAVVLRRPALAGLPMLAIYSVPVAVDHGQHQLVPVRPRRRRASCGCWSPTTSTGSAASAGGSPATAATSTCGSRRRSPPPASGSAPSVSAWRCCCRSCRSPCRAAPWTGVGGWGAPAARTAGR